MSFATLHTDSPVNVVTLNRPERLNAMGHALLDDLHCAMAAAQADPATRVIVFTGGVTLLLPQAVGFQKAMELLVLGERLDAATLLRLGLVNRVVPVGAMMDTALALRAESALACFADPATARRIAPQARPR